jgi:cytochrome b6-f complex iron-sulfur subunit
MSRFERRLGRFVDDLLRNRRPRGFGTTPEEAAMLRVAASLRAVRVGADQPDPVFAERLGKRLREEMTGEVAKRPAVSRRGLIAGSGAAVAAMVAGGLADRLVLRPGQAREGGQQVLVPDHGRWRPVAALEDLPEGRSLRFSTDAVVGYLVRREGRITALSAICTHLPCTLTSADGDQRLVCPCHPMTFDWNGAVASHGLEYPPAPLPLIQVRVRDGLIEVFA